MNRQSRWLDWISGVAMSGAVLLVATLAPLSGTRAAEAPEIIRIGTLPGLRFDTSVFSVRPNSEVELVFSNHDEMIHNLVITRPGARDRVVQAAIALGAGAANRDFVPPTTDVLWATKVVATGQSVTLKFTAPATPGAYPFVCTLPGHGIIMFGTMTVTSTPGPPVMTPIEPAIDHSAHTRASSGAAVTRGFMPETGPAAIAVQLPGGASYVFDAGAGRFRYAWLGTNPILPSSPERGLAKIPGQIFYREPAFPLRFGATPDAAPRLVEFKGYTLDAAGIPEFEIVVDGLTVHERAEVSNGRLVRRFRMPGATSVWFAAPGDGVVLHVTGGTREGAFYRFTGTAAQEFTVTHDMPVPPSAPAPPPSASPATP